MDNKILDILMVLFSAQIVKVYLDSWKNDNRQKKASAIHYIAWGMYIIFQYWVMLSGAGNPIFVLIINVSVIFLIYKTKYDSDNKILIFRIAMLSVIWMLVEVATMYVLGKTGMMETDYGFLAGSVISKIVMYILMQCLKYYKKNDFMSSISFGYWIRIIFVPITTVYIINNLFSTYRAQSDTFLMVAAILLLIVNVVIFDVYNELGKQIENEKKNFVYEQEIALCNKQASEREAAYEETRTIRHNINGYLLDLRTELLSGKTDEALAKIEYILKFNQIYRNEISHSGNMAVDSLINYKYSLALKDKIKMRCYVFIPDQLSIDGADLCIILNNVLDNAIEAVRKLPEAQRNIEVSVSLVKGNLSIMIQNPYAGEIKTDGDRHIITSKSNSQNHGIGLISVRRTVEKYNGEFLISFESGIFEVKILLYL